MNDNDTRFDDDDTQIEDRLDAIRALEALLFSSAVPLRQKELEKILPETLDVRALLDELERKYDKAGFQLERSEAGFAFRTAPDLAHLFEVEHQALKPLSRAALETLSIIAYHQPATRAEIEQIRGVATSKGTLDVLLEAEFIRMRGRRDTPGRPLTYGTTPHFLDHFGLKGIRDLPGLDDLKAAGLLSSQLPPDFEVPQSSDDVTLTPDEVPLEAEFEPDHEEDAGKAQDLA